VAGLLLLERVVSWVPLRLLALWTWSLSWVWWWVIPIRRRLAVENFRRVFPELPPGPALRRMMDNVLLGYLELAHGLHRPEAIVFEPVGFEPVFAHVAAGEGVILVAGHSGSWDLSTCALARAGHFPITALVKAPSSASAASWILRTRAGWGLGTVVVDKGAFKQTVELLERGEVVIFHEDQRYNQGLPVPFLGRDAYSVHTAAVAAKVSGAPVYGVEHVRLGTGRHQMVVREKLELTHDTETDVALCQAFLGRLVRASPHNWLWLHDRWKKP